MKEYLWIINVLSILVLIVALQGQLLPISNCLKNCLLCDPTNPSVCSTINNQTACIPFFESASCILGSSHKNLLQEDGSLTNQFVGWTPLNISKCILNSSSTQLNTIGPFNNSTGPIRKTITLPNRPIERLLIKFIFAINDININSSSNSQQTIEEVQPDGSIIIRSTNSGNSAGQTSSFMSINFSDISSSTYPNFTFAYLSPSPVITSCGNIYQYQITLPITTSAPSLIATMTFIGRINVTWNLVSFRVDFGCGKFLGLSSCNQCLSNFYQIRQHARNILVGCGLCPPECRVCSSEGCSICQPFALLDSNSKCNYPSNFVQNYNYTISTGTKVNGSSKQLLNIIKSSSGKISLNSNLPFNQSYAIKFDLLYTLSYSLLNPSVVIILTSSNNTQIANVSVGSLDNLSGAYINQISDLQKTYIKRVSLNSDFTLYKDNKINMSIISSNNQSSQQFYISNLNIIQYKCSNECEECTFNSTNCIKCRGFYDLTNGCRGCANGFFIQKTISNTCIKCHSTCKQCNFQSEFACRECFSGFQLASFSYNYTCISCLYQAYAQIRNSSIFIDSNTCSPCFQTYSISQLIINSNCNQCFLFFDNSNYTSSTQCRLCFIGIGLQGGACIPTPSEGYKLYGTDVNGLISIQDYENTSTLSQLNCSIFYSGLYGVKRSNPDSISTIRRVQKSLPPHSGLTLIMNIFKIDSWGVRPQINLTISVNNNAMSTETLSFPDSAGSNICEGDGNEMIITIVKRIGEHRSEGPLIIELKGNSKGLFIRQVSIYLGNCEKCGATQINYGLQVIPKYLNSGNPSGLDVWVSFDRNVQLNRPIDLASSFNFSLDKFGYQNLLQKQTFKNLLPKQLYYFLPINQSFTNGTLRVNTTEGESLVGQITLGRLLVLDNVGNFQAQTLVNRFDRVSKDHEFTISQVFKFFQFFNWFSLFTMIVFAFFGVGIVFQELSILLQLLFLHIYISTTTLPATFKIPLSGMQKMQNLNFFTYAHEASIQNSWIGSRSISSPHVFEQYNLDVMFLRSYYPIIIINLIYLGWFLLLSAFYYFIPSFKESQNRLVKFLRNIPRRPVNYWDQIWRYQFITTMWAAFIQFSSFKNDDSFLRINLAICIFAFVISLLWPMFVVGWTYYQTQSMQVKHFRFQYQDIFYRKIPSISDQQFEYYFYIIIRFSRYFIYAVFISQFIKFSLVGPVILICVNILQIFYLLQFVIFQDKIYLTFKIVENLLFILIEILLLILFTFSNQMQTDQYFNIGYALNAIYVIMIINATLRCIYLLWKKAKDFYLERYDTGIQGQVMDYGKNKLPIPLTQRNLRT